MTEYSFYNCIRYRTAKIRQNICGNQHVFCEDANCVANAEINIAVWCRQCKNKNTVEIDLSNNSFYV